MDVNRRSKCVVCNLTFNSLKDFLKHTLSSGHRKRTGNVIMDHYKVETKGNPPLVPQTGTKTEINCNTKAGDEAKAKAEAKGPSALVPQPKDNIYSKIKFRCADCNEEFRNKIALTTHSYSHNRKYLENTEYCDKNSEHERIL